MSEAYKEVKQHTLTILGFNTNTKCICVHLDILGTVC